MTFHVIIPARYQSTRLPGKPLAMIGDKPMIVHVCEKAENSGALTVSVATDNIEIKNTVESAGFNAVMTSDSHESGSDRIYEAAEKLGLIDSDIIVNVQGDEPFIPEKNISQVAGIISSKKTNMATLCCKIENPLEAQNPNTVKVVFDKNYRAIYFSRSLIPFDRDNEKMNNDTIDYYRHIGIYAYTKAFLKRYVTWPISILEKAEKLEQLRVLENGKEIYLDVLVKSPPAGIDTQEDLVRANNAI